MFFPISLEEFKKLMQNPKNDEGSKESTNQNKLINPLNNNSYETSRRLKKSINRSRKQFD